MSLWDEGWGRHLTTALLLALLACGVGRPAEDAAGVEIYRSLCVNCHGAGLEGVASLGPALGPGSASAARPDDFLELTIVHGRGRMPSFSHLSEAQVERLIAYIREVQDR